MLGHIYFSHIPPHLVFSHFWLIDSLRKKSDFVSLTWQSFQRVGKACWKKISLLISSVSKHKTWRVKWDLYICYTHQTPPVDVCWDKPFLQCQFLRKRKRLFSVNICALNGTNFCFILTELCTFIYFNGLSHAYVVLPPVLVYSYILSCWKYRQYRSRTEHLS